MPALIGTTFTARVTWLGTVRDRAASLAAAPCHALDLTLAGAEGESHGGIARPACSRVSHLHPRGTPILNMRQLSILSAEELAQIAAAMGLRALDPGLLGANIVVSGLPDFSRLPPAARLQAPSGATLMVDMENRPCNLPAKLIEACAPGRGRAFKAAAEGRRGVTAAVERAGALCLGDRLRLFIPDQPAWAHAEAARAAAQSATRPRPPATPAAPATPTTPPALAEAEDAAPGAGRPAG